MTDAWLAPQHLHHPPPESKMISDTTLMTISNSLGVLAALFIIIYQFFEVNARRTAELDRASYAKLD
ncbi:hypothetical protein CROQUDRAFT_656507 [Cronartium quercuum f. sp. fusiforme G11]|uniref:Uncharacterized protein n=1 Tax=Cronartium quercuum f. sp. fusiforme G11 TaxID=708437 RepID=A0A9P6NP26_9BASI|nr:hypothetical protein CROQUDRAFT_656507 [Cronartium quercuum f. sp. fusiforme G11]